LITSYEPCGDIFVPNVFSPNNDNANNTGCVYSTCIKNMKFVICDRWGEEVFTSNDPQICWDGRFRGVLEGSGVFTYVLNAEMHLGKTISKRGNITLMR